MKMLSTAIFRGPNDCALPPVCGLIVQWGEPEQWPAACGEAVDRETRETETSLAMALSGAARLELYNAPGAGIARDERLIRGVPAQSLQHVQNGLETAKRSPRACG